MPKPKAEKPTTIIQKNENTALVIPKDVWSMIAEHTSIADLRKLTQVNKEINEAVKENYEELLKTYYPQKYKMIKKNIHSQPEVSFWQKEFQSLVNLGYEGLSARDRAIRIATIEGDIKKLQNLSITADEIINGSKKWWREDKPLSYWASLNKHQHILDYFYNKVIDDHVNKLYPATQVVIPAFTMTSYAASFNQLDLLTKILKKHPPVDHYRATTHLVTAIQNGHIGAFEIILGRGADVNALSYISNITRASALYVAIKAGQTEIAERLLQKNADVNLGEETSGEASVYFDTPLKIAARNGDLNMVTKLLEKGATISPSGSDIFWAVLNNHLDVVDKLIEYGARDVTSNLTVAAKNGSLEMVTKLIEYGANARSEDAEYALLSAAKGGHLAIVEKLLAKGANINTLDHDKMSALHYAVENNHLEVTKALLQRRISLTDRKSEIDEKTLKQVLKIANNSNNKSMAGLLNMALAQVQLLNYLTKRMANADPYQNHGLFKKWGYSKDQKILAVQALIDRLKDGGNIKALFIVHPAINQGELGEIYNKLIKYQPATNTETNNISLPRSPG